MRTKLLLIALVTTIGFSFTMQRQPAIAEAPKKPIQQESGSEPCREVTMPCLIPDGLDPVTRKPLYKHGSQICYEPTLPCPPCKACIAPSDKRVQ
jgi:hypothetical protein